MRLSKFCARRHRVVSSSGVPAVDGDLFGDLADFERERHVHLLADASTMPVRVSGLEARHLDRDLVVAGLQQRRFEVAAAVGDERAASRRCRRW